MGGSYAVGNYATFTFHRTTYGQLGPKSKDSVPFLRFSAASLGYFYPESKTNTMTVTEMKKTQFNPKQIKAFLTFIIVLWSINPASAQDCDSTRLFLEAAKSSFYYQDTIVVDLDNEQIRAFENGFFDTLRVINCHYEQFFKEYFISSYVKTGLLGNDFQSKGKTEKELEAIALNYWNYFFRADRTKYYGYSYFKSENNWYTLTFLMEGKYVPTLLFINYSPQGKFSTGRIVYGAFVDAGDYQVSTSSWKADTLLSSLVYKWETRSRGEKGVEWHTMTDSTVNRYLMLPSGELKNLDQRRFKFEK